MGEKPAGGGRRRGGILARGKAAVDKEDLAGDVVRGGAGEEDGSTPEIFQLAVAADEGALGHLLPARWIVHDGRGELGGEEAGCDGVGVDAVAREGFGLRTRELRDAALRGAVAGAEGERA